MTKLHWFNTLYGTIRVLKNWQVAIWDRLNVFVPSNNIRTYILRNGLKYELRNSESGSLKEVWVFNQYTPKGFEIGEEDTVLDVGAHVGTFSILAGNCARKGRVFSFEPIANNFKMLKKNVKLNNLRNVTLINRAVLDKEGYVDMYLAEDSGSHSRFIKKSDKVSRVKATSLEKFLNENKIKKVDFLKLDCEGAEYDILFNSSNQTLKKIKKISMEVHNIDKVRNVFPLKNFLEKKGFSVEIQPSGDKWHLLHAVNNS